MKFTPYFERMSANGGKMVEFTGYMLPIQFENFGIIKEHKAVREKAGLFDVSHMGEFLITGPTAFETIQKLITNDITTMIAGQARYSPMANENGGIIDDILIYKFGEEVYMLVVNAANCEKDEKWIKANLVEGTLFENATDKTALLALQGPNAEAIIKEIVNESDIPTKNYTFKVSTLFDEQIVLSRTGYTGEDGFEIYSSNNIAEKIFDILIEKGKNYDMVLCGLGARDTLRMEASMPLYGHEMTEDTLATEVGLNFFVKMNKECFSGKKALETNPAKYKRMGIKLIDRGIARENCLIFDGDKEIGYITSGTHSPTLGYSIAMIRVLKEFEGKELYVEVRNRKLKAEVVPMPFYKRNI